MTAKFLVMNGMVTETRRGLERIEETRGQPLLSVLSGTPAVVKQILRTPATLFTTAIMVLLGICWLVKGTFWSILVTEKLLIPDEHLWMFTFARSMIMLVFYFLVMPRLRDTDVRKPLLWGLTGLIIGQVLLISTPPHNYLLLMVATALEAVSTPVATTLVDKLAVVAVAPAERARIMAILYAVVLVFTSPFGWIAGELSSVNRSLPFLLSIALFAASAGLIVLTRRWLKDGVEVDQSASPAADPAQEPA
jgi:Na+/melibiose symporter-like transporter